MTKESHGFDGFLGICVGHPNLMQIQNVAAQKTLSDASLLEMLRAEAQKDNAMTIQDILAVWEGKKGSSKKDEGIKTATISPEASRTIPTTPDTPAQITPTAANQNTPTQSPPELPTCTPPVPVAPSPVATTPPAPSTPAAKVSKSLSGRKRTLEDLAPGVRSPERMQNGLHCSGCHHDDLKNLISYERNHFNTNLCSQPNYPDKCSGCKKSLPRTKDPKACVEIKGVFHVRCCHNAINHRDHPCVFALCHRCWVSKTSERGSPKKKRAARNSGAGLYPGEILLGDGNVGAVNSKR